MNRRSLLQSFGALIAVCAVSVAPRKYGVLTVEGWRAHKSRTGEVLHVCVDGVDVTTECFEASDVDGYAKVFCRDTVYHSDHRRVTGRRHVVSDRSGVCKLYLTGRVVIAPGAPL